MKRLFVLLCCLSFAHCETLEASLVGQAIAQVSPEGGRPAPARLLVIRELYESLMDPGYYYLEDNYRKLQDMQNESDLVDEEYARFSPDEQGLQTSLNDNVAMHVIMAMGGARLAYDDIYRRHIEIARRRLTRNAVFPNSAAIETELMALIRGYEVNARSLADEYGRVLTQYDDYLSGAKQVELVFDYDDASSPRVMPLRGFQIEVASPQDASPAAQLFAGSLNLQFNSPIVRYWYLRYYRDQALTKGWNVEATDYFMPDPVDAAKRRWVQNDLPTVFQNQRPIAVTVWIPNGDYTLFAGSATGPNLTSGVGTPDRYRVTMTGSGPSAQVTVREAGAAPAGPQLRMAPEWTMTDFNLGVNEKTRKLEGTIAGRIFYRWNSNVGFQAQGEASVRSHYDFLNSANRSETPATGGLTDYFSKDFQVDFGPVFRYRAFQFGAFESLRYANREDWDKGGLLGQFVFTFNYVFDRGNAGLFVTRATSTEPVVRKIELPATLVEETYLRTVNQAGVNFQLAVGGASYVEGTIGYLASKAQQDVGGVIRHVLPPWHGMRFTYEIGLNESFIGPRDSWRVGFGIRLGEWGPTRSVQDSAADTGPVPVLIPRLRYEKLSRVLRTGNRAPVAIAGPDQAGIGSGTRVCLDGTSSHDIDGDTITYEWTQIEGQSVDLSDGATPNPCFIAGDGPVYSFRLVVTDSDGVGSAPDVVMIQILPVPGELPAILQFESQPSEIRQGETSRLVWNTRHAAEVRLTGFDGPLEASGDVLVQPTTTTTYTLNALSASGDSAFAIATVIVKPLLPAILQFESQPSEIRQGETSRLVWNTRHAAEVRLTGFDGPLEASGDVLVQPTTTTTYTLNALSASGDSAFASATVIVKPPLPAITSFTGEPLIVSVGGSTILSWTVERASRVTLQANGQEEREVPPNHEAAAIPKTSTTYTLRAYNSTGEVVTRTLRIRVNIFSSPG